MERRTVGVEEELLLVDPDSGHPRTVAAAVLRRTEADDEAGVVDAELQQEQVETETRPCTSLDEVAAELRNQRRAVASAASASGVAVAALATSPLTVHPSATLTPRYQRMVEEFGLSAQEQLTCGCHVHVSIDSEEEGVAVLDRIRPWLPALLAISANSPFWQERDSGYASYRSQVWDRWPSSGPTELFGSAAGYHAVVDELLASETILDRGMIYFHARLAELYPTVEVRVTDVCLDPDDAVLVAALARGLVEVAGRAWRDGEPPDPLRGELLRLASWRAGRSGLDGALLHPRTGRPAPAAVVVGELLDHVTPALADIGDLDTTRELLDAVLRRGTGARAQRESLRRTGRWADVVRDAVARSYP